LWHYLIFFVLGIQSAIGNNDLATFECLIRKISNNATIISKTLFQAAQYGNLEMVQFLVENASLADINVLNEIGETPLFGATYEGHLKIVNYLLDKGADVNVKARHLETPLFEAIRGCHYKHYRTINCQNYVKIIEKLKDKGADVNVTNRRDYSPLALASNFGQFDIASYLVNTASADVNSKSQYDETPIFLASQNGNLLIVKMLFEDGNANIKNVKTKWNIETTPLHVAAMKGHFEVVKYLVEKCPKCVNIKNRFGYTAQSVAGQYCRNTRNTINCMIEKHLKSKTIS
jgi:ankyrin repeat protein